ncbi:MAG: ABC transporter substrate-binding protein, partial [Candidatus Promineifilaceae bacterium]
MKRKGLYLAAFLLLGLLLVACQPQTVEVTVPVEVTRVITEVVTEGGEQVEITRVITEEVIVTATPEPEVAAEFHSDDPTTYTQITFGDIDTLDSNLAYDSASGFVLDLVMEGLVAYNRGDPNTFVPLLATEVPSVENGGVSEDGLTYTFHIRDGVTFHAGGTLEPHDIAYTLQRGLLQSDPDGPQWLFVEPILGFAECFDITE